MSNNDLWCSKCHSQHHPAEDCEVEKRKMSEREKGESFDILLSWDGSALTVLSTLADLILEKFERKKDPLDHLCTSAGHLITPSKPKEQPMEKWCEHIDWRKTYDGGIGWYVHGGGWGLQPTSETMFCPICGAKKPEQRKKLEDILAEPIYGGTIEANWKKRTGAAKEWMIEIIESANWKQEYSRQEIKDELISRIKEE